MRDDDIAYCHEVIRHGSLSFHAASRLLPAHVRDPALALYAFCRIADDAVDLGLEKRSAVLSLGERLELIYRGQPQNAPSDRAFASVVETYDMPRALPEALLEGLAWDAMGRRYTTLADLNTYCARVAAAVGAMMCVLMGVRDRHALARACDLGVAMQLTNIARDVGEDARAGRLYLPLDWLAEMGLTPGELAELGRADDRVQALVKRLLSTADKLYDRSEAGIPLLPLSSRPGIYAARHIYAAIGGAIERNRWDPIAFRARTGLVQKVALLGLATTRSVISLVAPTSAVIFAPPLDETRFLVDAVAGPATNKAGRTDQLLGLLAELKTRDHQRRAQLQTRA